MKRIVKYFTIIYIVFLFAGCKKELKYSKIPHIEFDSFKIIRDQQDSLSTVVGDNITINIKFQDGDGDIGLGINDIVPSEYDYILNVFAKRNGVFVSLFFDSGHIPKLTTDNVVGPIDGILSRMIFIEHNSPILPNDTVRFDVKIKDRAKNESNSITTPSIIVYK